MTKLKVDNPLQVAMKTGRLYKYKKGEVLNSSDRDTNLMLIESGFVIRYEITNSGAMSIQSIYGQGSFFPLTKTYQLLFNQRLYSGPETIYYEAMTDASIYVLSPSSFIEKAKNDQKIYLGILEESGKRFCSNIQVIENMSMDSSVKRVAHQLLYYAEEYGRKDPKTSCWDISIPLTHSTLAAILDVTRETVSQSIGELRDKHLVRSERGKIMVLSKAKLKSFVYS